MTYHGDKQEQAFSKWFNGDYNHRSWRSEIFYSDCTIGDEKTRQDVLYNWLVKAYMSGYEEASNEPPN
jgi:hypothetical protein